MKINIFFTLFIVYLFKEENEAHSMLPYNVSIDTGYDVFGVQEGKFKVRISALHTEKMVTLSPAFEKIQTRRIYHYATKLPFTMDEIDHIHVSWIKKLSPHQCNQNCNCQQSGLIKISRVTIYPTYVQNICAGKPKSQNYCLPKTRNEIKPFDEIHCEINC